MLLRSGLNTAAAGNGFAATGQSNGGLERAELAWIHPHRAGPSWVPDNSMFILPAAYNQSRHICAHTTVPSVLSCPLP